MVPAKYCSIEINCHLFMDTVVDVTGQMTFRDSVIHAYVDSDDRVTETDESNNTILLSHGAV